MPTGAAEGDSYHTYYLAALVYAPAMFMAYTGLRRAETQGLELRDVTLSTASDGTIKGSARVQRTKTRVRREWVTGTPKSNHSRRTVPLPPWLAAKMADYLRDTHPASHDPHAPVWPRRLPGGARHKGGRQRGSTGQSRATCKCCKRRWYDRPWRLWACPQRACMICATLSPRCN